MQMTGANGVLSVPDEHLPGLIVLILIGPVVWLALAGLRAFATRRVGWAQRAQGRLDALGFAAKVVLFGTLAGALVHAAIVPTHWGDARVTAILFVADTVGFAVAFWWTFTARRHWQLVSAAMLGGTACGYVLYILMGWETMDLVGLITTTIEAAAALVILSPVAASASAARQHGAAIAAVPVALVALLGTNVLAGATTATATTVAASAKSASTTPASPQSGSMAGMSGMSGTSARDTALSLPTTSPAGSIVWPDNMSSMAAGMKMAEPNCTAQPTSAQQKAAVNLVDRTVAAAQKYTSLAAAKAAGYVPVTREWGARRPLHQSLLLPHRRRAQPERDSFSRLREHRARGSAVRRHVPRSPRGDATATGRLPDPMAHSHRPVLQRRGGRRERQQRPVCRGQRESGEPADDARVDDAGDGWASGAGPACALRGRGGGANATAQSAERHRLDLRNDRPRRYRRSSLIELPGADAAVRVMYTPP